jgi:hypothetical protein
MPRKYVSLRGTGAMLAATRRSVVKVESVRGTRGIVTLANGERWDIGKVVFGRFTAESPVQLEDES